MENTLTSFENEMYIKDFKYFKLREGNETVSFKEYVRIRKEYNKIDSLQYKINELQDILDEKMELLEHDARSEREAYIRKECYIYMISESGAKEKYEWVYNRV